MIPKEKVLQLKIRQDIYETVSKCPGVHLSEMSRKLSIPKTTLNYHLRYLEKANLIESKNQNNFMRFFVKYKTGKIEKEILNLLREETPRHIIFYMLNNSVCSQVELSKELNKNPAAIAFHLKKLKDIGLIHQAKVIDKNNVDLGDSYVLKRDRLGNEVVYGFTKGDFFPFIYNLLITHRKSLPDKHLIVEVITMLEEGYRGSTFKDINSRPKAVEALIDSVYDIFPHPYHV